MQSIVFRDGAFSDFTTYSKWFIFNFGLLLPMGLAGLFYLKSDKIFFTSLLVGNLIVFNFMDYTLTYDIAKFATVLSLTLAFLSSLTVAHLLNKNRNIITRVLGAASLIVILSSGVSFTLQAGFNPNNAILTLNEKALIRLSDPDIAALNWLRKNIQQKDIVIRKLPVSIGYAQWGGGVSQFWIDNKALLFGFNEKTLAKRLTLQSTLPSDAESYLNSGVKWLVLTPDDKPLSNYLNRWILDKNILLRAEFPPLKIYEFLP